MNRHSHILGSAANLLGICFVIITGLRITDNSAGTFGDELSWVSALLFLASIVLSYTALRHDRPAPKRDVLADWAFMAGVGALTVAVAVTGFELR